MARGERSEERERAREVHKGVKVQKVEESMEQGGGTDVVREAGKKETRENRVTTTTTTNKGANSCKLRVDMSKLFFHICL